MSRPINSPASPASPSPGPKPKLGLGAALIGEEEEALVLEVIRSRHLFRYTYDLPPENQGRMTATLEREFCEMMGVKYALAVTSGTAALEVALSALGVGPGDEVIVAAWSWISCYTAVARLGARPVLAEIDESFCLAPGEIRRLSNARTKTVIVVHYQGVVAKMDELLAEAKETGISVLEDCAESPGAMYHGRRAGAIGDIGIYSFQYQKSMTSGEGGMVVTNDVRLYERAVRCHDLGLYRPYHHQFAEPRLKEFVGGQYRMNELTAAVAVAQRRKLDGIRTHCRALGRRIVERIGSLPGLSFREIPDPEGDSGFEIYFCLPTAEMALVFTKSLDARNVHCAKMTGTYCHYAKNYCINRASHAEAASPFRDDAVWPAPGYRPEDFPRTESLVHRFVALPLGVLFTEADADAIADAVVAVHGEVFGVQAALSKA